jgi:enoyl-CoA hydratase/carnithine racemase
MAYAELAALHNLVGRAVTLEILLEGRIFSAAEAKEKGLVTRVMPEGRVEEEAYATARRIADGAPLVARWHKSFVARLEQAAPLTSAETDEGFLCFDTKDFQIGYKAFLDKTKPKFEGR